MRKIRVCWAFLFVVLFVVASVAAGTQKGLSYRIYERNGYTDIEVTTALASYVFSEEGGVLKSLFLHFAPWGSVVTELVPGAQVNPATLERKYTENTRFPFALSTEEMRTAEVSSEEALRWNYVLSKPEQPSSDMLVVEFQGERNQLHVVKRFTIYNDSYYTMDVTLEIENTSGEEARLWMTLGDYLPKAKGPSLVYQFDGQSGEDLLATGSYTVFDGLGLMDKATVFFLRTSDAEMTSPFTERTLAGNKHFGVKLTAGVGRTEAAFSLYGGRRRYLLMEAVGLGKLDAPGTGARMMIPVIQFLELLYRYTGNYGWAIILFTLLTRIVLFPLMRKQFHSMAKMQQLQPKLKKLQERFKDDRQLMQQKLMELYKREGVNPLGGCLPLLIQLPILILLWKAILYSGEQIHLSPGFLWLPDLSLQDPYFILVILTTLAMMAQQWLMTPVTTGESAGSQKFMGYIFPIVMAVFLYRFPAGLWLYYFLTTVFQVGQQAFVNWELARAGGAGPALAPEEQGGDDGDNGDDQEGD